MDLRWAPLAIGAALLGCTSAAAPTAVDADIPAAARSEPTVTTVTAPGTEDRSIVADPVVSGWGSTGVRSSDRPAPYWVIGTVALTTMVPLSGVRLTKLEVFDADGVPLGVADRELRLDIAAPSTTDVSDRGTAPFDGRLVVGRQTRLRFHGRMDDRFADALVKQPHRYRLTLLDDAGGITRISAVLGPPWPTA